MRRSLSIESVTPTGRRGIHLGPHISDALHTKYVKAIMSPHAEALHKMEGQDLEHLPVIPSHEEPRVIGVITRHDILSAYRDVTAPKKARRRRSKE